MLIPGPALHFLPWIRLDPQFGRFETTTTRRAASTNPMTMLLAVRASGESATSSGAAKDT